MSIGNLQKILHDIHNLLCDLILKHESTSPEFIWGFQCSLLGSKIHYLGQEKSNSLHGSTQVVNIHYLGQIHNLGQNTPTVLMISPTVLNTLHGTQDIPHIYHDIPHGTEHPSRYSRYPPHGTHDIPHGTEHPPQYCTHIIQGGYCYFPKTASISAK